MVELTKNLKIKIIYVFVMFAQLNKDTWKLGKLCHVGLIHPVYPDRDLVLANEIFRWPFGRALSSW